MTQVKLLTGIACVGAAIAVMALAPGASATLPLQPPAAAAPPPISCTVKDVAGVNWQIAACTVGTRTCVTSAGRGAGGVNAPLTSTAVTCF
jgi:hypothetical protein